MTITKMLGAQGERHVAHYLEREGFTIRAYNYTRRVGEIDVIAQKGETLAFVEVKLRTTDYFNTSEVVTPTKQRKIIATARYYIAEHKLYDMVHRFDIALITAQETSAEIIYIPNAFTSWDHL